MNDVSVYECAPAASERELEEEYTCLCILEIWMEKWLVKLYLYYYDYKINFL